ncbi:MAG TPA: lytic transglycosylase domain-containing protein [Myxococcales bacterium]|jgi:soluble lytic murein transglycosylase-like protein
MRILLATACCACLALAAGSARAADKLYQYTDEDGVTVITNVPQGQPKKALRVKQDGEVTKITAPLEFAPSRSTADYDGHIQEACSLYRIPPALVRAVMATESNFNPKAVSPKGAMGLMQLMPGTATEMFVADPWDPKQNIHGGVRYLRVLANMFNGDMVRIVAAYNAGPESVKRADGIPLIAETQEYVKRVLRLYFSYKNETNDA